MPPVRIVLLGIFTLQHHSDVGGVPAPSSENNFYSIFRKRAIEAHTNMQPFIDRVYQHSQETIKQRDRLIRSLSFPSRGGGSISIRSQQYSYPNVSNTSSVKKRKRRNNTGFYYGITDDLFFPDATSQKNDSNDEPRVRQGNPNITLKHQLNTPSVTTKPKQMKKYNEEPTSSTLADIMGETLLELREMREDISALREEMQYMKEELRLSKESRGPHDHTRPLKSDEEEGSLTDEDAGKLEFDEEPPRRQGGGVSSFVERVKRQKEFLAISMEVEQWAQQLLREDEEHGWKEVKCNKMMKKKLNPYDSTRCYIKWMKDSRGTNADYDDREYPCLKCYGTINAPLDLVCEYLSEKSHFPEYNDLLSDHRDLEEITPQSKITWSMCPQILFIKSRDFVTFCHHRYKKDGTQVIVNQACEHESSPGEENESDDRPCRAFALRGANFLSRDPDDPNKTRFTLLAHANPGGGVPTWAMKTAVNAVAPIEPFKLYYKLDTQIETLRQTLGKHTSIVSSSPGRSKPAGIAQLGYACFWPSSGVSNLRVNSSPLDETSTNIEEVDQSNAHEKSIVINPISTAKNDRDIAIETAL